MRYSYDHPADPDLAQQFEICSGCGLPAPAAVLRSALASEWAGHLFCDRPSCEIFLLSESPEDQRRKGRRTDGIVPVRRHPPFGVAEPSFTLVEG